MTKTRQGDTQSLYFSPRITAALNGILDYPLTVVEAPMGYGKTTAVREFLSNSPTPVLWQTVYDATRRLAFGRNFAACSSGIDDNSAQSLLELGFPHDSVLLQEAVRIHRRCRIA